MSSWMSTRAAVSADHGDEISTHRSAARTTLGRTLSSLQVTGPGASRLWRGFVGVRAGGLR